MESNSVEMINGGESVISEEPNKSSLSDENERAGLGAGNKEIDGGVPLEKRFLLENEKMDVDVAPAVVPVLDDPQVLTPPSQTTTETSPSDMKGPEGEGGVVAKPDDSGEGNGVQESNMGGSEEPSGSAGEQNPSSAEPQGVKDSEGFLAPPPASTLFIRRARSSSTGAPTYVVSPNSSSGTVENEGHNNSETTEQSKGATGGYVNNDSKVKRRPGRPVGSVGPYKRKKYRPEVVSEWTGEVRVSSRMSTSIFKHDISGVPGTIPPSEDSPYIYPTAIRTSQLSGGKPPLSGFRRPYSKDSKGKGFKKDSFDNIDPLTGKRRYTKRKKGDNRRETLTEDNSGDSEPEAEPDKAIKFHLSDNGIWRPTDDLRLIVNMEATSDLESVFYGVKFSCYFTYKEIEERWRKLLFTDKASLVSQNAIIALHPDVKAKIYHDSLFSPDEEKTISAIKVVPDANPDIKLFQNLLEQNPQVFNKHRTSRSLMMHWLDMKDFNLLSNQNVANYNPAHNFEDFEDVVCENVGGSDDDIESESVLLEIKTEERCLKKKLRLLDDEINAWQAITGQIIEDGMKNNTLPLLPTDFDGKTFALLRGKEVYYGMTSREIILGRSTRDCKVDADLTEEGSSSKIARKQAIIQLKRMGRFVIINKGKRPIFVDRKVVPFRCAAVLRDQSVIQIAQINLIFFVNEALISRVIERDVSGEIYASFKDLENDNSPVPPKPLPPTTMSTFPPRHHPVYSSSSTTYGVVQSNFKSVSHGMTVGRQPTSASNVSNNSVAIDTDGTFVPICQPPASYVTIS